MDVRLLDWARAVKARNAPSPVPPLWLFTDAGRLPDLLATVARLPRGLAGVVFRHDADPDRAALGPRLARLCRERRLALVVAGDARLAMRLGAGVHLRGGVWRGPPRIFARLGGRLVTSSAHDAADLLRARRAGADACFLSPVFPTASHPGGASLGVLRWSIAAGTARRKGVPVLALGGIDGASIRLLPRGRCAGAGAIGALA
jgi:thiamine-phosphate pyrophosphorylase